MHCLLIWPIAVIFEYHDILLRGLSRFALWCGHVSIFKGLGKPVEQFEINTVITGITLVAKNFNFAWHWFFYFDVSSTKVSLIKMLQSYSSFGDNEVKHFTNLVIILCFSLNCIVSRKIVCNNSNLHLYKFYNPYAAIVSCCGLQRTSFIQFSPV